MRRPLGQSARCSRPGPNAAQSINQSIKRLCCRWRRRVATPNSSASASSPGELTARLACTRSVGLGEFAQGQGCCCRRQRGLRSVRYSALTSGPPTASQSAARASAARGTTGLVSLIRPVKSLPPPTTDCTRLSTSPSTPSTPRPSFLPLVTRARRPSLHLSSHSLLATPRRQEAYARTYDLTSASRLHLTKSPSAIPSSTRPPPAHHSLARISIGPPRTRKRCAVAL